MGESSGSPPEGLEGRTALVTGAARNIGRAIAIELARRGARVVVHTRRDEERLAEVVERVREQGVEALPVLGDLGEEAAIDRITDGVLARFGGVDILVNNAAIRPARPFLEMSREEWHRVLAVDLHAAFHLARALVPGMVERGWGRIINLTGMNAIQGYAGRAHVSVAKHGLWGLTRSLARELGPSGVTVNAISPGPIATGHDDPAVTRHIAEQLPRIPVGRLGEPGDIAAVVALLASERGGFVSGQMIAVNGGAQT